jgi:hypothetical protein
VAARWEGTDGREALSVLLDTSGDILHPFIFREDQLGELWGRQLSTDFKREPVIGAAREIALTRA